MNETKRNSNAIGIDRIAIMTALNLADDLLKKDIQLNKMATEKNEFCSQLKLQNKIYPEGRSTQGKPGTRPKRKR